MWENSHLPEVGPTPLDSRWNIGKKSAGMLNELEKARIYIEQLHNAMKESDDEVVALTARLQAQQAEIAELRALVEGLRLEESSLVE